MIKKYISLFLSFVILCSSLFVVNLFNVSASSYATIQYYDTDGTLLKTENGTPGEATSVYEPTSPTRKFVAFYTDEALTERFDGKFGEVGSITKLYAKWYTSISDFENADSPYNQYAFREGSTGSSQTNHRRWGVSDGALKYNFTYNPDTGLGGKVGSAYGNGGATPVPVGILTGLKTSYTLSPYTTYKIEFDYKVSQIDSEHSPNGMVIRVDRAEADNLISKERRALEYGNTVAGAGNRKVDLDGDLDGNDAAEDNIVDLDLIKVTEADNTWHSFSYSFTTFDWENRAYSVDTSNCNALVIQASGYGELYVDNIRLIREDEATAYSIYDIDGTTLLKKDFGFPYQTITLETPYQPNKTLLGFYLDMACKNKISQLTLDTPEVEHIVYAKWDSDNPLTFNINNGFASKSYTLSKYADLPDMDTYIKMSDYDKADFEGMEFAGWYSSSGEEIKTVSKAETRADNKLYAAWNYSDDKIVTVSSKALSKGVKTVIGNAKLQIGNTYELDLTIASSATDLSLELYAGSVLQTKLLSGVSVTNGYKLKAIITAHSFGAMSDMILKSDKTINITNISLKRLSAESAEQKINAMSAEYSLEAGTNRMIIGNKLTLDFDYENKLIKAISGNDCYLLPTGLSVNGERLFINPQIEKIQDNDVNGNNNSVSNTDSGDEYRFEVSSASSFDLSVKFAEKDAAAVFGVVGALKAGNSQNAMRFLIRVGASDDNKVLYNGKEFTVKEHGAVIATRTSNAYENLVINGKNTIRLVSDGDIYNKTESYYDYTVKVTGISSSYKKRTVVCRGYMILTDANGNEFTVYSDNALATNYNSVENDKNGKYVDIDKCFDFSSADYVITYPKFNTSYLVIMRLEELAAQINEKYNITVALQKDTAVSAKEILIGNTSRTTANEAADGEYTLKLSGQRLMLLGNSPETLVAAIDKLSSLIEEGSIREGYTHTETANDIGRKEIQDYRRIWTDNFDGDRIDGMWDVYTEFDTMETDNNSDTPFTMFRSADKDHVYQKDGKLYQHISRPHEYYGVGVKMTTSNSLWFRYGYTEVSAKISPELGTGPGFWLVGQGDNDGDLSVEFDIIEVFGNSKHYKATPLRNRKGGSAMDVQNMDIENTTVTGNSWQTCPGEDDVRFSDEYHTFGLEWTEEYYSFILDGEVVYSVNHSESDIISEFLAQSPVYIIVSTTANKAWWERDIWNGMGSMANENTDWQYGSEYAVEYVHLYQKAGQYSGKTKADVLNPKIIYGDWVGGIVIN